MVGQETQMIHTKSLGCDEVVLGEKVANILLESCRLISREEGVEIVVLERLVDSVLANTLEYLTKGRKWLFYHETWEG